MLRERLVESFKEPLGREAALPREEAKTLPAARAMRSIVLPTSFVVVSVVAMTGWSTSLGWVTYRLVGWLFS
jgi:hypothetical protein